jgi:secreted trypsin-like serine protease
MLGFVDNNRTVPNQLQRANKFAMSHSECLERIDPWTDFVPTSKLCTRAIRNTLGVCQGDSGGPLVETVDGKTVLVGVVSFVRT